MPHDFVDRRQYLHARQTLTRLLELGCVPIVNENDAIANDEIRFGDNDRIAALVAHLVERRPARAAHRHATACTPPTRASTRRPTLIDEVAADDPLLGVRAGGTGIGRGSGGMASQAGGGADRVVVGRAGGDRRRRPRRTCWPRRSPATPASARRSRPTTGGCRRASCGSPSPAGVAGTVVVDDGARRALVERGTSLLPAGVVDVVGQFDEGDTRRGRRTRRRRRSPAGMVLVEAGVAAAQVAGQRTSDLPADVAHEVIHRDDLVVLPA